MKAKGPLQTAITLAACPFCGGCNLREHKPFFGKGMQKRYPKAAATSGVFATYNPLAESYAVICEDCQAIGPAADDVAAARLFWDLRSRPVLPKK